MTLSNNSVPQMHILLSLGTPFYLPFILSEGISLNLKQYKPFKQQKNPHICKTGFKRKVLLESLIPRPLLNNPKSCKTFFLRQLTTSEDI